MYEKLKVLFKSSSIYTVGNIMNRSLFLISMPIMTRYLTPSEYGKLSLVNAVTGILSTLYGLAVGGFAMRSYYDCKSAEDQKKLFGTLFWFLICFASILSILLTLYGSTIFEEFFKDISFSPYMLLGIWICFFSVFEMIPDVLFRANDQAVLFISVGLGKAILGITFSILSVVVLSMGAEGPLTANLITTFIFAVIFMIYIKNKIAFTFSVDLIWKCLKFSLPVLLLLLGRVILDATDRIFLQKYVDISKVGLYSVGATIGSVLVMISSSINAAWVPFFYQNAIDDNDDPQKMFTHVITYLFILLLFIGLCPIVFRHEIIFILAPKSYYPIIKIIPVIMMGAIFNALFFIPVVGIYQVQKTYYLISIILFGLILNVSLNMFLIPKYGMMGAASATLMASMVMLILCHIISQKVYHIPYQYFRLAKAIFLFIVCAGATYIVNEDWNIAFKTIGRITIICLYPTLLIIIRFFNTNEISRIKELLHR